MARKKKDSLSAFDAAMNEFGFNNPYGENETTNIDNTFHGPDIDYLDKDDDSTNVDNIDDDNVDNNDVNIKDDTGNVHDDDDTDIPDNILNNNNDNSSDIHDDDINNQDTNVDNYETEGVGMFFDAFAEELGWDVADDQRPESVTDLVEYIKDVVEQNSVPQYADERVQQLDAYIKNGGRFEDFYTGQQQQISYDNIDIEDESNQKAVVREYLKYQGYTDDQISRKIERYEDGDMLEDEASDAVAMLRDIQEMRLQQQMQMQEQARQAQMQEMDQFMHSLTDTINSLDNIRGVAIPKEDRRALYDYITRTDENGLTRYQRDFQNNFVNNLIESAYFTMKGDTLIGEATRSGRTSAANKLRTMLKHLTTNHSRYNVNDNKQRSVLDIASMY